MMVRTDILEKNNLEIPTNYQELVEVCESAISKAKNGELYIRGENSSGYSATEWRKASSVDPYYPFPIAFGDMWVHEFLGHTAAVQNGGKLVNEEGKPGWNSAETETGLQILRDFVIPSATSLNKNALTKEYGADYDVGKQPFAAGDCIFKLLGPWDYVILSNFTPSQYEPFKYIFPSSRDTHLFPKENLVLSSSKAIPDTMLSLLLTCTLSLYLVSRAPRITFTEFRLTLFFTTHDVLREQICEKPKIPPRLLPSPVTVP